MEQGPDGSPIARRGTLNMNKSGNRRLNNTIREQSSDGNTSKQSSRDDLDKPAQIKSQRDFLDLQVFKPERMMSLAQKKRVQKELEEQDRPKADKRRIRYEYQNPFDGNPKSIDIYFAQKEGKLPLNEVISETESTDSENMPYAEKKKRLMIEQMRDIFALEEEERKKALYNRAV